MEMNNESRERTAQLEGENKKLVAQMAAEAETFRALAEIASEKEITAQELKTRIWEVMNNARLKNDHKIGEMVMNASAALQSPTSQ